MNWRAKSPARLEVFMGVLLYVNIRREDTSPEAIDRRDNEYCHVTENRYPKKMYSPAFEHTRQDQVLLAKTMGCSPRQSKQIGHTRRRKLDSESQHGYHYL